MKTCSHCQQTLPLEAFAIQSTGKLGRRADCKECFKRTGRTIRGLIKSIISQQKVKSKKRKHLAPTYTEEELIDWWNKQPMAAVLYARWVASNYETDLKPSIDRLDDYKGYSLDNIQLVTVKENIDRYYLDAVNGINTKSAVSVDQYAMDGTFIASHHSYKAAAKAIGQTNIGNIRNVSEGLGKTAYGYLWRKSNGASTP